MKTVLIPTDFTSASLQLIEETIRCFRPEPVSIILFHAFEMPESLQDATGADSKPHLQVMNERFRRGCKRLKDKYGVVVDNIIFRHMYGNSVSVFKNYLHHNKIEAIIYPDGFVFAAAHDKSVNPATMIKKSKCPVVTNLMPEVRQSKVSVVDANGQLMVKELLSAS